MKILKKIFNQNNSWILLATLSGLLLFLAYPPQNLWFLVFFALVPLFWSLFSEKINSKKAFWAGTIAGFIFMAGLFVWLFQTAPFEWLGVESKQDFLLILLLMIFLWLFQVFLLGIIFGMWAWLIKKTAKINSVISLIFILPCSWIIFEYLRSWWFGFIWLGKETFFGPHWTFGNLAYALHKVPTLIQSADVWGIYGISFIAVLINVFFFLILKFKRLKLSKTQILLLFLGVIIIFTALIVYGNFKIRTEFNGEKRELALMQTNFSSDASFNTYQRKEICKKIVELFQEAQKTEKNPDFIIAPEGLGIVSCFNGNPQIAQSQLTEFWKPEQIYLESRKIIDEKGKVKSRLFYYDLEKNEPLAYYEKRLLVPNGDFLPYLTKFLINLYSFKSEFKERLYQKGEINIPAKTPKGIIGGTICSSVLSPEINKKMTQADAEFLVIVSSDAPFHGSKFLLTQNLAMSQFRAVENRRYFAQATNMGYSFLINPKGEVVLKSKNLGNEILFADIGLFNDRSFYVRFGDWFVLIAFLMLLLYLIYPQALTFFFKNKK